MKILITGGAGFIGSHLARYCQNQGHTVAIIDKDFSNHPMSEIDMKWNVNLTDYSPGTNINMIFDSFRPDVCFHLAAYASEGRSNHIREYITRNNTLTTMRIINYCVKYDIKLVFTSSVAVYSGPGPWDEFFTLPRPIDEYGLSKFMSECSIRIAAETQGLRYCIVRPRNVYGPGQNMWDPSRNLFGIWMYNTLHNKPCLIYGDGMQKRCFTYIDDLIPSLYKAKDVENRTVNLGNAVSYHVKLAGAMLATITGYDNFEYVPERHEVKEAICDTKLSQELLDWPRGLGTTLHQGLSRMWAWAQEQPDRPLDAMPPLEVNVNAHQSLK